MKRQNIRRIFQTRDANVCIVRFRLIICRESNFVCRCPRTFVSRIVYIVSVRLFTLSPASPSRLELANVRLKLHIVKISHRRAAARYGSRQRRPSNPTFLAFWLPSVSVSLKAKKNSVFEALVKLTTERVNLATDSTAVRGSIDKQQR